MNRTLRYSRHRQRNGFLRGARRLWDAFVLVLALASVALVVSYIVPLEQVLPKAPVPVEGPMISAQFVNCAGRAQAFCVVDGDTVRVKGVKIRIADIDTPEVFSPQCASEEELGHRATRRMTALLNAGPFEVGGYARDEDKYGRKLRILRRDGRSLGEVLVAEGLARRWDGARHSWCG